MNDHQKNQKQILEKLEIGKLNPMQEEAHKVISKNNNIMLLSPTGTGKTLAFLLPILKEMKRNSREIEVLILVPSRELAIQIEQVVRDMGSGYKANAVYGGRPFAKDKIELNHPPAILIGTPGRVADHLRRSTFSVCSIKTLILDEFDKSLETGFEADMSHIVTALPNLEKKIFTSATSKIDIPDFTGVKNLVSINFIKERENQLKVKTVISPGKDKSTMLLKLLSFEGDKPGIIFCNFKETIQEVSSFLNRKGIDHSCFQGGMEQKDRERALLKFRNGTHRLLLATDLAARGIDIPEIQFIIHFQLPIKYEEFIHRNGRTARMNKGGTAYVIKTEKEELPDFIHPETYWDGLENISELDLPKQTNTNTLFISGGRKDKISKGDIAGLFLKKGNLEKNELGNIELKQDCAFVAVPSAKADRLISKLNNSRLKKKKVRIFII